MEMNTKKLDDLIKLLAEEKHVARIGVLGQKDKRSNGSNAAIGAAHEYGTSKLPARSFLRMPLNEQLFKYVSKSEFVKVEALKEMIESKNTFGWFKKLAAIAERVVLDAFATAGFGKWASHSPGYTNNTGNILVDTTQLRDSITTEVK